MVSGVWGTAVGDGRREGGRRGEHVSLFFVL